MNKIALTTNATVWKFIVLISVILTLVFAVCFYFKSIFITMVIGLVLIIIAEKLGDSYHKIIAPLKLPIRVQRIIGWTLFLVLALFVVDLIGDSFQEVAVVFENSDEKYVSVVAFYNEQIMPHLPGYLVEKLTLEEWVGNAASYSFKFLSSLVSSVSFVIVNGILIIPLMFVMYFKRRQSIKKAVLDAVPKKFQKGFKRATRDSIDKLFGFFSAKIIESTIIALICGIGFYLAGLKGWLVLAFFAGLLNIVPYIGPLVGAIPPLLIGVVQEPLVALYVFITIVVAQLVDNLYLIPFMINNKVKVDPLVGIILVLVGAQVLGAMGMIFAIPVFLVYQIVLSITYSELVKIYK